MKTADNIRWLGPLLLFFCLLPVTAMGQFVIYIDPTHKAGEKDYISTTKKLITEINKSATATAALYTTASEEMKKLERLKREQYNALTTAYAFYTDELRIKRFNETLGTVKRNLQLGFSVIEANPQASFFFRDRLIELIAEVNDAERVFKQATVIEGEDNQMSNADRNALLFKAEEMIAEIAKEGQNIVNVGKMITLDPERMEELAKKKYHKQ